MNSFMNPNEESSEIAVSVHLLWNILLDEFEFRNHVCASGESTSQRSFRVRASLEHHLPLLDSDEIISVVHFSDSPQRFSACDHKQCRCRTELNPVAG